MSTSLVIVVGNSDDKLTQREWSGLWRSLLGVVTAECGQIHGQFAADPVGPWQNACVVVEGELTDQLRARLGALAAEYRQDSIAVIAGPTEFVG